MTNIDEATVIGHGNVAIDVARMLLKDPEAFAKTDMPTPVVEKFRSNRIRKVTAVGRRGPAQVSFTTKEFREMLNLPGVKFNPIDEKLMADARGMVEGDRPRKRLMDLMSKGGKTTGDASREFELGFLKSPQAFLPAADSSATSESTKQKVSHIKWSLNTLLAPPAPPPMPPHPPAAPATTTDETPSTAVVARPTGEETTTPSGLVIESVGYRSESLAAGRGDGWALPFDEKRGRIVNEGGRVVDESGIMVSPRASSCYHSRSKFVNVIDSRILHGRMGGIRSYRCHCVDNAIRVLGRIPDYQRPLHPAINNNNDITPLKPATVETRTRPPRSAN